MLGMIESFDSAWLAFRTWEEIRKMNTDTVAVFWLLLSGSVWKKIHAWLLRRA